MPSSKLIYALLSLLILAGCLTALPTVPNSGDSGNGPTVETLQIGGKNFLLARLNPIGFQLRLVENSDQAGAQSIGDIHDQHSSVLSFNGSFFDQDFRPLGLLVSEGRLLAPLSKSELMNGIFTVNQKGQPRLFDFSTFQNRQQELLPTLDFAIQSGPILLDEKSAVAVDEQNSLRAGRTALGLDQDNNLVVLMLRQSILDRDNALTLYEFAQIAASDRQLEHLGLHSLINLDGGNSSGLATSGDYYPELEKVQHVIIAVSKATP
jgi:uncharacterized protein YigE (DUF2233 family)